MVGVVLRGLFAGVFVLGACFGVYGTPVALVLFFGAYSLGDGLVVIIAGVRHSRGFRPGWLPPVEALLGVGAVTFAFLSPSLTAIGLSFLIVGWATIRGAREITATIRLREAYVKGARGGDRRSPDRDSWRVLVTWPTPVSFTWLWLGGAYALIIGLQQIGSGSRISNLPTQWMRPLRRQPVALVGRQVSGGLQKR